MPQLLPPVSRPMVSTLIGAEAAAVVGSGTTTTIAVAEGCAVVSESTPTEASNGMMTNGTGFESAPFGPGFWICTVTVAADCTSDGFSAVAQACAVEQVVPRGAPLMRMVDALLPLPATKFVPRTARGKLSTAPAKTLEGRISLMSTPLVMAMVAVAYLVWSAWLVAISEIAFGDGAAEGAV